MIISWLGHSCFKLQDKAGAEGITVITDPYDKKIGLKMPSVEADIVTVSHDHYDHNNVAAVRNNPYLVNMAGEYDVKGVAIHGVESNHDDKGGHERGKNVIYRFEIDDISVTHLGDLATTLSDAQLEALVGTDILLIPVGGKYTLDAKKAVEVISQIEPRIVIPMHYKTPDLAIDDIDGLEKFIKEFGVKPTEEQKLKISKKDLPQEDVELVILSM